MRTTSNAFPAAVSWPKITWWALFLHPVGRAGPFPCLTSGTSGSFPSSSRKAAPGAAVPLPRSHGRFLRIPPGSRELCGVCWAPSAPSNLRSRVRV
jgi:hypothetical protein